MLKRPDSDPHNERNFLKEDKTIWCQEARTIPESDKQVGVACEWGPEFIILVGRHKYSTQFIYLYYG